MHDLTATARLASMPMARSRVAELIVVPVALFAIAFVIRVSLAGAVPFPTTEVSAYFVGVAANALDGGGFVSDAVWSYATPPLEAPKPAFEIWLPMASFIALVAMALVGPTFEAAQLGGAVAGAAIAPLVWLVGREAARAHGLDERRGRAVAIASGLLAAVVGPFVLNSVVPDSYVPFTLFVLVAAVLLPRVLGLRDGVGADPPRRPAFLLGLALGLAMGLAYLSRQEVIWLGLVVLAATLLVVRGHPPGTRLREAFARLWPVVAGGLVAVVPWLARNTIVFGTPMPGQAVENMFLTRNEDIFAFADRPDAATYLGQGLTTVLANPVTAAIDGLVNVLILPPFPIGLVGVLSLLFLRRSPALRRLTALSVLLVSGTLIFVTTVVLFPVATLWGTFAHASGPLLAGLIVASALGGDALLARISAIRRWERPNIIVAPIALLAIAIVLTALQLGIVGQQSRHLEGRYAGLAAELVAAGERLGTPVPDRVITDHPMWLAGALERPAIALPDEPIASIVALSRTFSAPWVVVVDERGRYPERWRDDRSCLARAPIPIDVGTRTSWLFVVDPSCPIP